MRLICHSLGEGKKVLLFPEGTRGEKDELQAIKQGIALLVSRSNTAVIPAFIDGTFAIWNRERRFPKLWGRTTVVFGSPIRWEDFAHLDKKQAQEQFTNQLTLALNNLREWCKEGARGIPP